MECIDEDYCTTSAASSPPSSATLPSSSIPSSTGLSSTMIATETPTPVNPYSSGTSMIPPTFSSTILLITSAILYTYLLQFTNRIIMLQSSKNDPFHKLLDLPKHSSIFDLYDQVIQLRQHPTCTYASEAGDNYVPSLPRVVARVHKARCRPRAVVKLGIRMVCGR